MAGWPNPIVDRGRSVLTVDIRSEDGRDRCLSLAARADVLIEGFRPKDSAELTQRLAENVIQKACRSPN
jgi:hypothetical protein